jgi:hypothetical protein
VPEERGRRRIFGHKRKKMAAGWRIPNNKNSSNINRTTYKPLLIITSSEK